MKLNAGHLEHLRAALLHAFPSRFYLEQMVRNGLDQNMVTIAEGQNLSEAVFQLTEWAVAQSRLEDLLTAARTANPTNSELGRIITECLQTLHPLGPVESANSPTRPPAAARDAVLPTRPSHTVLALILTALPVEYQAVRAFLTAIQEVTHPQGTIYERGRFASDQQTWEVAIGQIGAGNAGAALEAERAINHFNPAVTLFVGVAGGLKDVQIGDVVAATRVYGYESGKADDHEFLTRPDVGEADYRLIQRARAEANKRDWTARIQGPVSDPPPQVFVGPLAAGEKVLSGVESATRRLLRSHYGDALAVEMEGRGFLQATHANNTVAALVIRGISDLLAGKQWADAQGSQTQAARHASAFAFQVLSQLPRTTIEDPIPAPTVLTNIWFTPQPYGFFSLRNTNPGTLTVGPEAALYQRDQEQLHLSRLIAVTHTRHSGDLNNNWVRVDYIAQGRPKIAFFANAKPLGVGNAIGGSEALLQALSALLQRTQRS